MSSCPKCNSELELMEMTPEDSVKTKQPAGKWYVCHKCKIAAPECEIWSRVVGYLRPTNTWNKGKAQEFVERKEYKPFKEEK